MEALNVFKKRGIGAEGGKIIKHGGQNKHIRPVKMGGGKGTVRNERNVAEGTHGLAVPGTDAHGKGIGAARAIPSGGSHKEHVAQTRNAGVQAIFNSQQGNVHDNLRKWIVGFHPFFVNPATRADAT
jgi:hypothetical protein